MSTTPLRIAFFGTPEFALHVVHELDGANLSPLLVVTQPDKPRGRGQDTLPTPMKLWALEHSVDVVTPSSLRGDSPELSLLHNSEWDLFVVASYGHILPKRILELPRFGVMNVHPSLLPKLRGASPVRSAILTDQRDAVGVSIILLDEEMDHGPILAQARIEPDPWPVGARALEDLLAEEGGKLLAEVIPLFVSGGITPEPQDHALATYTTKIEKPMGEIDLNGNPHENLRRIKALEGWPSAYFFVKKNGKPMRVKVVDADINVQGELVISRVIPEGKAEMEYTAFLHGLHSQKD
jgi:methionyl-tRNA formyltransferase